MATAIVTAGTALVGVGALSPAGASMPATATATAHCRHPLKHLPPRLRKDLRHARHLPAGQRGPAVHRVVQKARQGGYGAKAKTWAEHRIQHHKRVWKSLPTKLRHDLRAVHKLPAADRPAARKAIRAKVLAGDYGTRVQQRAERKRAHRQACRAQHKHNA